MVKQDLILSMSEPTNRTIYAKKGDSGRLYDIFIADAEKENGTLRILQPDGSEVTAPAIIEAGGDAYKGDLVTFDALEEVPLTKCEVTLESSQDLHGYANPWPSGGGKNLLNVTATSVSRYGLIWTVESDGTVKVSGEVTGVDRDILTLGSYTFKANTGYILNGCPSGGGNLTYKLSIAGTYSADMGNGGPVFTPTEDVTYNIRIDIYAAAGNINLTFKPMLRLSTVTDASFAPYSNICPIEPSNGKNLLPNVKGQNGANYVTLGQTNPHTTSRYIYLTKGEYTLSTTSSKSGYSLFYCDNNGSSTRITSGGKVGTFTLSADGYYAFYIYYSSGITTDDIETFQLEQGSTATPYVPYQGINVYHSGEDTTDYTTYPLSLGQSVYGGTLDVVSGKLVVDKVSVNMGLLNWVLSSGNNSRLISGTFSPNPKPTANTEKADALCSVYKVGTANQTYSHAVDKIFAIGAEGYAYVYDSSYSDADTFKADMSGQQLVYELATPIEVDLTPTQISTLLGENNVWSSGEVEVAFEYDGLLAQLPEEATEQVGKCIGDVAFTGASSMPFILHILDDVQEETP